MKRLFVVLAVLALGATTASAQKVRVMSYNVHNCAGVDGIKSIERCAELVRESKADIVAIQEVDSMTTRNKCYVLGTNGSFDVLGDRVYFNSYASDHLPLYVDVKIGKAKKSKK